MERSHFPDLEDVRKQVEFDRQMSMARVHRMRGDYVQAAEAIRLALRVKPEDADAQEFAADILAARGELEKAGEVYKALHEADPARASAEEKFARVTLQIAEGKRQQFLLRDMAENPDKYRKPTHAPSPLIAALVSTVPGLGQIYCGQFVKGAGFFLGIMCAWLFLGLMGFDWKMAVNDPQQFVHQIDPFSVVLLCLAIALHTYAFVDAPVYANKLKEKEKGLS